MKIILLAGGPGSGKSTQGSALMSMNAKFKHLSAGEIVRQYLDQSDHPITQKYGEIISQGKLLPDEVIHEILTDVLSHFEDKDEIILLDGYPRTPAQYEDFKKSWGKPAGLIHLEADQSILADRMMSRSGGRTDDNQDAITQRLRFYQDTTKPLLDVIKQDLGKDAITVNTHENTIHAISVFLYSSLQRIEPVHAILQEKHLLQKEHTITNPEVKPIWFASIMTQWWQTGIEYSSIRGIQAKYETQNFSFSLLHKTIVYLETPKEIQAVLNAQSHLGHVYRHFSISANLQYDFVATDMGDGHSYKGKDDEVNVWKLIHNAFGQTIKTDKKKIEYLIDKHLDRTLFAEKTFELDTTFDAFFCGFWSEYLFGKTVSLDQYQFSRNKLLKAMKHCFYTNEYKCLDPYGFSSFLYSEDVFADIREAKFNLQNFINIATVDSAIKRFKNILHEYNEKEQLGLDDDKIEDIIADCAFDLFFEPDFLENVMYEALAYAIKENADLRNPIIREKVYNEGINQGYLFPIRTRVLDENVILPDGKTFASGTLMLLNMKQAGLYHSYGPRRCIGQAYTYFFKDHFFNRIQAIEFKVKKVTEPYDRQLGNENVPNTPERYLVSWHLKRDEAMHNMSCHDYKGNNFFDVLSLHQNPGLNSLMVKQLIAKVNHYVEKHRIDWQNIVIVTPEVRGIPIASQVADRLQLPLLIIRKQGGYKMSKDDVSTETYQKGYGEEDTIELPIEKIMALSGMKVVFLDDGLASGESAKACIRLLEKQLSEDIKPAEVVMVLALLQHDYVKTLPKFAEHQTVKTLFDCRSGLRKAPELESEGKLEVKNARL